MALLNINYVHTPAPLLQRILLRSPPPRKNLKLLFNFNKWCHYMLFNRWFHLSLLNDSHRNWVRRMRNQRSFWCQKSFSSKPWGCKVCEWALRWKLWTSTSWAKIKKMDFNWGFCYHLGRKMWANGGKRSRTEFCKLDWYQSLQI